MNEPYTVEELRRCEKSAWAYARKNLLIAKSLTDPRLRKHFVHHALWHRRQAKHLRGMRHELESPK